MSDGPVKGFLHSLPGYAGATIGLLIAANLICAALQPYMPIIGKIAAIAIVALILITLIGIIIALIRLIIHFRGGGGGGDGLGLGGWD